MSIGISIPEAPIEETPTLNFPALTEKMQGRLQAWKEVLLKLGYAVDLNQGIEFAPNSGGDPMYVDYPEEWGYEDIDWNDTVNEFITESDEKTILLFGGSYVLLEQFMEKKCWAGGDQGFCPAVIQFYFYADDVAVCRFVNFNDDPRRKLIEHSGDTFFESSWEMVYEHLKKIAQEIASSLENTGVGIPKAK